MQHAATAKFLHLGVLLALLIAAEVRSDLPPNEQAALQSSSETPVAATEAATDATTCGEASAIARTPPAPRRAHRVVFACRDGVTPVFSDRPCGDDEHRHRLDVPSPAAGSAPSTRPAASPAATPPRAVRAQRRVSPDPPNACARLEEQLALIDARMRQGYSAREAARLWQRWRDAKAKLRAARC
jgi:hypothetical protein